MPKVRLWEAVALVLEIDPRVLKPARNRWMRGAGDEAVFESSSFPSEDKRIAFEKAMSFAKKAAVHDGPISLPKGYTLAATDRADVLLREVVAFFLQCEWPDIPAPLLGLLASVKIGRTDAAPVASNATPRERLTARPAVGEAQQDEEHPVRDYRSISDVAKTISLQLDPTDYLAQAAFADALEEDMVRTIRSGALRAYSPRLKGYWNPPESERVLWVKDTDADAWFASQGRPYRLQPEGPASQAEPTTGDMFMPLEHAAVMMAHDQWPDTQASREWAIEIWSQKYPEQPAPLLNGRPDQGGFLAHARHDTEREIQAAIDALRGRRVLTLFSPNTIAPTLEPRGAMVSKDEIVRLMSAGEHLKDSASLPTVEPEPLSPAAPLAKPLEYGASADDPERVPTIDGLPAEPSAKRAALLARFRLLGGKRPKETGRKGRRGALAALERETGIDDKNLGQMLDRAIEEKHSAELWAGLKNS